MAGSTRSARKRARSKPTSSTSSSPAGCRGVTSCGVPRSSGWRSQSSAPSSPRAAARRPRRPPRPRPRARRPPPPGPPGRRSEAGIARTGGGDQPDHDRRPGRPRDDRATSASSSSSSTSSSTTTRGSPRAGRSNADASVWTFKIRQGVKFNDGTPMTVDDVVYSFKSQCDPEERRERPLGLRRHARAGRRREGGRQDGRLPPRGPERRLPRCCLRGQLQHDHRPEPLRLLRSTRRSGSRHRPVS